MPTSILGLQYSNLASSAYGYPEKINDDNIENSNLDLIDRYAGNLTASFSTKFFISGAMSEKAGQTLGIDIGLLDRVIKSITVYNRTSGSGATASVIDFQHSGVSILSSSFSLSPTNGDNYVSTKTQFASASYYVVPGLQPVRAICLSANPGTGASAQRDVTILINWIPSGTFLS